MHKDNAFSFIFVRFQCLAKLRAAVFAFSCSLKDTQVPKLYNTINVFPQEKELEYEYKLLHFEKSFKHLTETPLLELINAGYEMHEFHFEFHIFNLPELF